MADHHECAAIARQPFLQPFNRGKVKMVGRLIHQQQVRLACQRAANCGAALFSAACGLCLAVQINAQLVSNRAHRIFGWAFFTMNGKIDEPVKCTDVGVLF